MGFISRALVPRSVRHPLRSSYYSMRRQVRYAVRDVNRASNSGGGGCNHYVEYVEYAPPAPRSRPKSIQRRQDLIMAEMGGILVPREVTDLQEQLIMIMRAMNKLDAADDGDRAVIHPRMWQDLNHAYRSVFGVEWTGLRQGFVHKATRSRELSEKSLALLLKLLNKDLADGDCRVVNSKRGLKVIAIPDAECEWYDG